MPDYAKMRGTSFVIPPSWPGFNGLGSIYVDGPSSNALTYRDHSSVDTPLIGGTLASAQFLIKRKRNMTGVTIPVETVVALKVDGSICLVESDVAPNAIGTTLEPIANGAYGSVLLLGASAPNVVDGMGFTSGDIIYAGPVPGVLTNDVGTIVGAIKIVGIADCPTDTQSSVATDLLISIGDSGGGGGVGGSFFVSSSVTILRGFPVTINSSGNLAPVDISNEDSAYAFCGVTSLDVLIGGTASVLTAGSVLSDIPASFGLTGQWGKPIFVSHAGVPTLIKPDVGVGDFVSQDFILSIGITTKNPNTGTTDLILNPRIVGRLV